MSERLPPPRDGTQRYLAAIHDRLAEILDRLPPPRDDSDDGPVELREPNPKAAGGSAEAGSGARTPRPTRSTGKSTRKRKET